MCTLVCLCAVIGACAESLDEWNRACRVKTAGQTSVYALSDSNCAGTPVATLPMGTYCKTVSTQEGIWLISYMLENGQKGSGFALQWDFEPAVVTYVDSRGEEATMQELKWLDLFGSIPEYNDAGEEPVTLPGEETAAAPVQTASAPSRDPIVIYEAYLSDDSGIVTLYRYGFAQVSGQVESGCPVRVTDLQEQGYVFVTMSELFYYKGFTPETGIKYYDGMGATEWIIE